MGLILTVAITMSVIAISGCVEEEVVNKIIVGTSADFPPFEYIEDGAIVGFDIEMVTMILEDLNYTVEVQDIAFEGLIGALKTGKIDVIAAAMSIDPEREKEVDFTIPYYEADLSVLIRSESNISLNETNYLKELANLTIGAQTGTTGADWVYENLINITNATMGEDQLKRYETYTLAVLDLANENLDAVIIDKPVGEAFAEEEDMEVAYTIESDEEYGLAVQEGNSELLEELNQGLTKLMGTEEWNNLVKKYLG
jgi:polar amino acid transport system substrate-binding protein